MLFRFRRADAAPPLTSSCSDAPTTVDMNECYVSVLGRAEARRGEYLAAALERNDGDTDVAAMITQADAAYRLFADAECGAIYQYWIEGSIRNVMALTCRIGLTDRQTHTIWENWLTYMDSTPPLLPEPEPTR
ncbi:hypothetical protein AAV99_04550 [Aurantiacibacter marinus]|uniref:Lysozyme inhibitor LprI-like N-terminal domain-containing protein n=1 Tax=Aurantiacibacter marinus TaxID=874156 RepID=A0A0H0XY45_9SPHN|nr:hypothetical protein AAV99_04550 [Aurantiacibacter marinus]